MVNLLTGSLLGAWAGASWASRMRSATLHRVLAVLLHGVGLKPAGSLSPLVSLPTMLVALARYSRDQSFGVLRTAGRFAVAMTLGSVPGTVLGGLLLGWCPEVVLLPVLVVLLLQSAVRV